MSRPDLDAIETQWNPNHTIVISSKKQESLLLEKCHDALLELLAYARALEMQNKRLWAVLQQALDHVEELEKAWQRGVLMEPVYDAGGTHSNRNVKVRVLLTQALKEIKNV